MYIVNSIDTTFSTNNVNLNQSEFIKGLTNWIKLGEPLLIQFKCWNCKEIWFNLLKCKQKRGFYFSSTSITL